MYTQPTVTSNNGLVIGETIDTLGNRNNINHFIKT